MVDFPEAERPVNQMVKPRCLRYVLRSLRESDGCQVMLLVGVSPAVWQGWRGMVGLTLPLCSLSQDTWVGIGVVKVRVRSSTKENGYWEPARFMYLLHTHQYCAMWFLSLVEGEKFLA